MRIFLVLCVVLALVAAEYDTPVYKKAATGRQEAKKLTHVAAQAKKQMQHTEHSSKRKVTSETQLSEKDRKQDFHLLTFRELINRLYNTLNYLNYCQYDPDHLLQYRAKKISEFATRINKQKQRKHKPGLARNGSDNLTKEVVNIIEEMQVGISTYVEYLLVGGTPDSIKENTTKVILNIFVNWRNQSLTGVNFGNPRHGEYPDPYPNAKARYPQPVCDFVYVVIHYLDHCVGREQECLLQLAQILTEEQKKQVAKKRYGPDHDYLMEAIKELVDHLEYMGNPDDEAILLLAKAVSHLFDDINILIREPKVETNVLVFLDIYNVLQLTDNCAVNDQCHHDCCEILDELYPSWPDYG